MKMLEMIIWSRQLSGQNAFLTFLTQNPLHIFKGIMRIKKLFILEEHNFLHYCLLHTKNYGWYMVSTP